MVPQLAECRAIVALLAVANLRAKSQWCRGPGLRRYDELAKAAHLRVEVVTVPQRRAAETLRFVSPYV